MLQIASGGPAHCVAARQGADVQKKVLTLRFVQYTTVFQPLEYKIFSWAYHWKDKQTCRAQRLTVIATYKAQLFCGWTISIGDVEFAGIIHFSDNTAPEMAET